MTLTDSPKVVPATAFGRRFRSTTEARWAVFLTTLGVEYQYEPETYDLGAPLGWYLPDFFMPSLETFLEVKPALPAYDEVGFKKAAALASVTDARVLIAHGFGSLLDSGWGYSIPVEGQPGYIECHYPEGWDAPYAFSACRCGVVGVTFEGRTDYIRKHRCGFTGHDHRDCPRCPGRRAWDEQRLKSAYYAGFAFRPDSR